MVHRLPSLSSTGGLLLVIYHSDPFSIVNSVFIRVLYYGLTVPRLYKIGYLSVRLLSPADCPVCWEPVAQSPENSHSFNKLAQPNGLTDKLSCCHALAIFATAWRPCHCRSLSLRPDRYARVSYGGSKSVSLPFAVLIAPLFYLLRCLAGDPLIASGSPSGTDHDSIGKEWNTSVLLR